VLKQNPKLAKAIKQKSPRAKQYKEAVKKTREKLRKEYGIFSEQTGQREKLLEELKKSKNKEKIIKKLLCLHPSTKERLEIYPELYKEIFKITGKPKIILDLGCGMNPVSCIYTHLKQARYYATEISKKDCEFLNNYFRIMGIKGKAMPLDLKKTEKIAKLPKADLCLLFKVLDTIEEKGHKLAEKIIKKINADWIIASFATKSVKGTPMRHPYRGWMDKMLKRIKWDYKIIKKPNEIFYIINKRGKKMKCDPKKITHKHFEKLEIRAATIKAAKLHPAKKEYILALDLGPAERDMQAVAGLKQSYTIKELIGKQCIAIINICPEKTNHTESTAMILTAMLNNKPRLIQPDKKVKPGVKVYGIMDSTCTHLS